LSAVFILTLPHSIQTTYLDLLFFLGGGVAQKFHVSCIWSVEKLSGNKYATIIRFKHLGLFPERSQKKG